MAALHSETTMAKHPLSFLRSIPRFTRIYGLALVLALGCVAASGTARAQELGTAGNLAFGAERLFGLYFASRGREVAGNVDLDMDTTVIGLGWSLEKSFALLTIPRLGIDYFITENFTVGGSFGLASVSIEDNDVLGVLFAARAGYALRLSHEIAFWPRGGLTFAMAGADADINVFSFTLEGMFSFSLRDGWSFLAGPVLDLGVVGEWGDGDYTEILLGLMVGLEGWVDV
jgi:hypothetical protein